MGGTQLGWGTKSSSFSGREAWGGGQGKAGLASQLDLPLWVSACLAREGTLLTGWGGRVERERAHSLRQGQREGKAAGCTSSTGREKERAPAENERWVRLGTRLPGSLRRSRATLRSCPCPESRPLHSWTSGSAHSPCSSCHLGSSGPPLPGLGCLLGTPYCAPN